MMKEATHVKAVARSAPSMHVSALYCPDGERREWCTDERGAELLRRMLAEGTRPGGEWADVRVEVAA